MGGPSAPPGCSACSVGSSCVLSALPQEEWAKLDRKLHRLHLRSGEVIFHQGVPVAGLYILCQGYAKLVLRTPSGKRLLVKFCGPGDLLAGDFSDEHVMSAVALDEAVVSFLPKELALELLERWPELAVEVARRLSRDRHMLIGRLAYLAYGGVDERLARGLLELGKHYGVRCEGGLRIEVPLSLRDLAEMIGASPQTTSQELHALAKRGLVKVAWPTISILAPHALRRHG